MNLLVLIQHPQHVLRIRHHIRRRYVLQRADVIRQLPNPAATDLLLLASAQVVRITNHAALAAA